MVKPRYVGIQIQDVVCPAATRRVGEVGKYSAAGSAWRLGSLALCLCNPITVPCGVELTYTFTGIGFRCAVAIIVSLLGLVLLFAIATM